MQRYTLFNKSRNFSDIFFSKIKFYNYFYKIIRKICTENNKTILEVECYIYYIMYGKLLHPDFLPGAQVAAFDAVELAQLGHGGMVAACDVAERVAAAHGDRLASAL